MVILLFACDWRLTRGACKNGEDYACLEEATRVMRWGEKPSFLNGACDVASRDEDTSHHFAPADLLRTKTASGNPTIVTRKQTALRSSGPRPGKRVHSSKPMLYGTSVANAEIVRDGSVPAAIAPAAGYSSIGPATEPLLVCAGAGVSRSNNDEDSGGGRIADRQATAEGNRLPKKYASNGNSTNGMLARSDSELELIIRELREQIFRQQRTDDDKEQTLITRDDDTVHLRKHLKNPVEKMHSADGGDATKPFDQRRRPSTSVARLHSSSDVRSTVATPAPILTAGAIALCPGSRSNASLPAGSSSCQSLKGPEEDTHSAAATGDKGPEGNQTQHAHHQEQSETTRIGESAVLNARPVRAKPSPAASTNHVTKEVVVPTVPTSSIARGSKRSGAMDNSAQVATTSSTSANAIPRRRNGTSLSIAVQEQNDPENSSGSDTDANSPVGPWVQDDAGPFLAVGGGNAAATSPSALSPSLTTYYDDEIASLSPRSRLLWLSDLGSERDGGSPGLSQWHWQRSGGAGNRAKRQTHTRATVSSSSKRNAPDNRRRPTTASQKRSAS